MSHRLDHHVDLVARRRLSLDETRLAILVEEHRRDMFRNAAQQTAVIGDVRVAEHVESMSLRHFSHDTVDTTPELGTSWSEIVPDFFQPSLNNHVFGKYTTSGS